MRAADLIGLSVANLGRRKVRTTLTLIGVVIGVGALVLMVSLGIGLKLEFLELLQSEDLLRTLLVSRGGSEEDGPGFGPGIMALDAKPVTEEDIEQFLQIEGVTSVTPLLSLVVTVQLEDRDLRWVDVRGVPPEEEKTFGEYVTHGRLWSGGGAPECLFPSDFFERFDEYRPEDFLGKKVVVGKKAEDKNVTFTVVGIVDSDRLGMFSRGSLHTSLAAAFEVYKKTDGGLLRRPFEEGQYAACEVRLADPRRTSEVRSILKDRGFSVFAVSDMIRMVNTVFLIIEGFLACIGAVGLIVALFGIANTMAMSVLERTREIGIMKALGTRRGVIRRLFLLEAAWIGALGGAIGLFIGWTFGMLLNTIAHGALNVPSKVSLFHVSLWLAAGSVLFAVLVSLVAGVMPAMRASRLDPVHALRYEA